MFVIVLSTVRCSASPFLAVGSSLDLAQLMTEFVRDDETSPVSAGLSRSGRTNEGLAVSEATDSLTVRARLLDDLIKWGDIVGVPVGDDIVKARLKLVDSDRHVG